MKTTDPEELAPVVRDLEPAEEEPGFATALRIIQEGRARAWTAVNQELVGVYWQLGGFLSEQVAKAGWGKGTIARLAQWLARRATGTRGLSASNLWRTKQFFLRPTATTQNLHHWCEICRGRSTC